MAKMGKCLQFYLKYHAEMDRLYWQPRESGEQPQVIGLTEDAHFFARIKAIGDAACQEAAEFLEICAERIKQHSSENVRIERVRRDHKSHWSVAWGLSSWNQTERLIEMGFWIDEQAGSVIPWIWCRGSREVAEILGLETDTISGGTIRLRPISLKGAMSPADFDVEIEPIAERIIEELNRASAHVESIEAIGAKRSRRKKPITPSAISSSPTSPHAP